MKIKRFEFNMFPVNCYVLWDETKEAVVIDPGCFYEEEKQVLKKFILSNELHVKQLQNTHLHLDHIFGNPFMLKEFGLSAEANKADVIVFEYLEMKGKLSGKKKQKLQMWRKRDIQKRCGQQAHRKGIRISRICAWNTSRLAFDGSGEIARDTRDHRLCTFQTGKRYNCDLSASYNIGARYFIRENLKPLPETERSLLEAKVPAVKRRTSCVYADLRELISEMELRKAA